MAHRQRPPPLTVEEVRRIRLHQVWNNLVELQDSEGEGKTADVHFICADGLIPAHTAILANVSPVLKELFLSQGADYFGVRSVLLPEYPISEIEQMIELIYKGSVDVSSEEDANNLRKLLREFKILDVDKLQFGVRTRPAAKRLLYYVFQPDLLLQVQGKTDASKNSVQGVVDQGPALGPLLVRAPVPTATTAGESEPNFPPGDVEMEEDPLSTSTSAAASATAKTNEPESVEKQSSDSDDDIMFVEVVTKPKTKNILPPIVDIEMKIEPVPEQASIEDPETESESEDEVEDSGAVSEPKEPESVPVPPTSKSDSETSEESPPVKRRTRSNRMGKKVSEVSESSNQSKSKDQNSDGTEGGTPVPPQRPILRPRSKATPSPASAKANPTSSNSNQPGDSVSTLAVPVNPGNRPGSAKKPSPSARMDVIARNIYPPTPSPPGTPTSATPPDPPNRSLRPRVNLKRVVLESDDDAGIPSSDSDEEGFNKFPRTKRNKARIPTTTSGSSVKTGSKDVGKNTPKKRLSTRARPPPPPQNVALAEEREPGSESESENDGQEPSFYKDPKRIFEEAKVCRGCNTKYAEPRHASDCVTEKHKLVRCYFCFSVFKNTELLFQHYKKDHRKAGKEDHLICPYCQNSVPHRSVSTHVISNHIFKQNATPNSSATSASGPSRNSTATPVTPKKKSIGAMKLLREKKAGTTESESDDDELMSNGMVMEKKSSDGNVRVFIFDKDKGKKK